MQPEDKFEGWAILELMGHRRLGGYVRETQIAGAGMLRIDIPSDKPKILVILFPASWSRDGYDYANLQKEAYAEAQSSVLIPTDVKDVQREWRDDGGITQFYPPSSLYGLTPVTESMARAVAKNNMPQPVSRWEMPQIPQPAPDYHEADGANDDDGDNIL